MRIKLGYPLLIKQAADFADACLVMAENADYLQAITHLTTDSREVMPGDLFVALVTDKDDGNKYSEHAIQRGASALLCSENHAYLDCCRLLCGDTLTTLAKLAAGYAATIPHKTIAVTGSVGKTTTRRFIASVLSESFRVHESPQNYNNLLGNALLLLSMPRDTEYLVAECGMNMAGEIEVLSKLLCPDYAVITNIGISHIASLGSEEAIGYEKLSVIKGMRNGILLSPQEDPFLSKHAPVDTLFLSSLSTAENGCYDIRQESNGIVFSFRSRFGCAERLHIPTIGLHTLSCAAFAVQIGFLVGMSEQDIRHGLSHYTEEKMRQSLLQLGAMTVLFDAYNACPASMKAACNTTVHYKEQLGGNAFALLGDMYELGSLTEHYHREIGAWYAGHDYQHLYFHGHYAAHYAAGAIDAGYPREHISLFSKEENRQTIAAAICENVHLHDVLLIKGSRGMKMEEMISPLRSILLR